MRPERHVVLAIEAADRGERDSALLHACLALDGTAKRQFGLSGRINFKTILRENYDIIEAMLGYGIDATKTKFDNLDIIGNGCKRIESPDLADVVYHIFRCSDANGDDIPEAFTPTIGIGDMSSWVFAKNKLQIPDNIIWSLLAVAVFAPSNRTASTMGEHFLKWRAGRLGSDEYQFKLREWWGRADGFRSIIFRYEKIRVEIRELSNLIEEPKSN